MSHILVDTTVEIVSAKALLASRRDIQVVFCLSQPAIFYIHDLSLPKNYFSKETKTQIPSLTSPECLYITLTCSSSWVILVLTTR